MPDPALSVEGAAKALLYVSLLLAIGASAVHWLLLPRVARDLGAHCVAALDRSISRLGLRAVCIASGAILLRVWTHTVAVFGFEGAGSWDNLVLVAFRSRWGQNWKIQVTAAAVCTVCSAAVLWQRRFWPLVTVATSVFAATIPLLGHAAGNGSRMALHVVHILAAGVWLGSLTIVVAISDGPIRFAILRRFSAVALPGAVTVVSAGLIASWLYLGGLSNLWLTDYGRILVLKVGLVGGVGACGYINWQRLRNPQEGRSMRFISIEVTLAVAVAIISGFLTEIAHP